MDTKKTTMMGGILPETMAGLKLAEALQRIGIPAPVFKTILFKFAETNRDKGIEIQGYLQAGELAEVGRLSHMLKGSSGNIGADGLYGAALAVDSSIRNNEDTDVVASHVADLLAELEVVLKSLAELQAEEEVS